MIKLAFVMSAFLMISACAYNPAFYDEQRAADNNAHDHQNGI